MHWSASWPHAWTDDPRSPLWVFRGQKADEPTIGLFFLSIPFWIELLVCIVAEIGISAVVATLLFKSVKRHSLRRYRFLIGYGFFVAGWILIPKRCVDALGVNNKVFRFCLCVISPTTALFRTTATLHGFEPIQARNSLSNYRLYYASPLNLIYDSKTNDPVRVNRLESLSSFINFACLLVVTGGFQSLFHLVEQFPSFGKDVRSAADNTSDIVDDWYESSKLWDLTYWKNNVLYALLFQLYLSTFGEGLLFITQFATGMKAQPIMDNPLFESSSPSDFWGRRWNLIIHQCLKDGVYKPVRSRGGSPALAVGAAFLASGLFHEWLLPAVFFDYPVAFGFTTLFFAWQGLLVSLESLMGDWKLFVRMGQTLPAPLRTLFVILLGVPLGHWFCDSYVRSDFFHQGSVAFPCFLPVE